MKSFFAICSILRAIKGASFKARDFLSKNLDILSINVGRYIIDKRPNPRK